MRRVYRTKNCVRCVLFKPYLVEPILNGTKTQVRRLWNRCLVKVGGTYKAKTSFSSNSTVAALLITCTKIEKLGRIDRDGIKKGACRSLEHFKEIWIDIYGS